MRVFSQGQLAQRVAQVLVVAFLWTTTFLGVVPASAQVPTRSTQATGSVAVVPFENLTSYHPGTFGDEAAAAITSELRDRLLISNITSSADVADQMKNLDLKPPLSDEEKVRLATELEVDMLVTGEVRQAEVIVSGSQRYAQVQLAILLFDRASAANVNGAFVTAKSPPDAKADADTLIKKALQQAAFVGVQEMKTRPTVTAMVLWASGDQIFTNTGTRGGIAPGMKMVAIRDGQRIGVVTMTSADATGSYGKVTEGTQLRTGDHLRAIFELPQTQKPTIKQRAKSVGSGLAGVLVPIAVLLGVSGLASSSRRVLEGNYVAGSMRSSNLANAAELGTYGPFTFTTYGSSLDTSNPTSPKWVLETMGNSDVGGAAIVNWQPLTGSQKTRLGGYVIKRDGTIIDVVFVPTQPIPAVIDSWQIPAGTPHAVVTNFLFTVDTNTGEIYNNYITDNEWEPGQVQVDSNGNVTYGTTWASFHDGLAPTGPGDTVIASGNQIAGKFTRTTPAYGMTHEYTIEPLVIENEGVPGGANYWQWRVDNTTPTTAQHVTVMLPPPGPSPDGSSSDGVLITGSADTGLSFTMYNPIGADEMVVQIARDPGVGQPLRFKSPNLVQHIVSGFHPQVSVPMSTPLTFTADELNALPGTSNIFWIRVGARNRTDQFQATPYPPPGTISPTDPLNDDVGWVWWLSTPLELVPPPATSTALKVQRATLSAARSMRLPTRTRVGARVMHK